MVNFIINKNPDILKRNLKIYNINNSTNVTLPDLNIDIFGGGVFVNSKLVDDNFEILSPFDEVNYNNIIKEINDIITNSIIDKGIIYSQWKYSDIVWLMDKTDIKESIISTHILEYMINKYHYVYVELLLIFRKALLGHFDENYTIF